MINDVQSLIDAFGGKKPFAQMVGVSLPPVYRAIEKDKLPHRWKPRIMVEAQRRDIEIAPRLLGLEAA